MTAQQGLGPSSSVTSGAGVRSGPGGRLRVGCSGWIYKHWRGNFYPPQLPQARWLEHYARHFNTVELNNSFYRLPEAATFRAWRARAPRGFVYAVKASRFLTHMKKLKDPASPLRLFFSRATLLGPAMGPVLYQLPPGWRANVERLRTFLQTLPRRRRHAIEFRDPSWYCDEVIALLKEFEVALCLHDMPGSASGRIAVGPFVYTRFHGTTKYSGSYSDRALDSWADWLAGCLRQNFCVFAYFNNDAAGHAPRDAIRLREAVERRFV